MDNKNIGVCVQIGLDFTAEMNYLTRDDWRKQIRKQVVSHRVPKSIYRTIDKWRFIGVDSNQESVDKLQEQYPDQEFICMSIESGADLQRLFKRIDVGKIDVLAMDIEGSEYNVLNSYSGDIIPEFVSVECHRWHHSDNELIDMHARHGLEDFRSANSYKLHRVLHTNQEFEYPTVELQFLKEGSHSIQVKDIDKLRIFLPGLPHTITREDFNACAFTMKILRFDEAMVDRGHEVIHVGNAGSKTKGTHVDVVPKEFYEKHFGRNLSDKSKVFDIHEYTDFTHTYLMRMCSEIRMRARPGDIVVINYGAHCDKVVNMLSDIEKLIICEMSVGYINSMYAPFRVFESYSNQEFHKGGWNKVWEQWNATNQERQASGLESLGATLDAVHNTQPQFLDDVVPIFLDPRQFEYKEKKGDYYLYLGRIQWSKGIDLAIKTCEAMGEKLLVAGQSYGAFEDEIGYKPPSCVELIGHANVEERRELMANAKGGFVCTYYSEPGGHVMIEYLLSGTPIITTDWGNMPHVTVNSVIGYRVRSGKEAELAVKNINAGLIKSEHCRKWAMNFTMEKHARSYEYYFRRIRDYVMHGNNNDLYYEHSDVDLSIRDMIHPYDPRYDMDLNPIPKEPIREPENIASKISKATDSGHVVSVETNANPKRSSK